MALGKRILTWHEGKWHEGNLPVLRAADFATWLGNQVFDGARSFERTAPDLDLHCQRIIRSAEAMGMRSPVDASFVEDLAREGIAKYDPDCALYIRPMMWSAESGGVMLESDPASTVFVMCIEDLEMPKPGEMSLSVSPFTRPRPDMAITNAKAASLYPLNSRIFTEARSRGFNNALTCDVDGNVCETASSNIFMRRGGTLYTPAPNGSFLNGLTRQRVIKLLRADGIDVQETTLRVEDFHEADEIFLTANAAKILPFTRFEEKTLEYGEVARRARELYWNYAKETSSL